jgi:hypothetical protein
MRARALWSRGPCEKLSVHVEPVRTGEAAVPLSEDEQRILSEIEQRLYESDPHLAREVSSTTVYTHPFRGLKWATLGFFAGIVLLLTTLSTSFFFAFIGFLVMLGSALVFERNVRRIGRVGMQQISNRRTVVRSELGGFGQRLRERFRRDDD